MQIAPPPSDAELQFIAAILHYGDATTPRALGIEPSWLTNIQAQRALEAIYAFSDHPSHRGGVPGRAYLQQFAIGGLPEYWPSAGDLPSLSEAVRIAELRRRMVTNMQDILRIASLDPVASLEKLQQLATDPSLSGMMAVGERAALSTDAGKIVAEYLYHAGSPTQITGVPTPFATLNRLTHGIQKGEFWVIYAPEKNYKTWVALEFVRKVYMEGKRVLVVSSEMTPRDLNRRLFCSILGLDYGLFRDYLLPPNVVANMQEDLDTFEERANTDVMHFSPLSTGIKAVEEVRSEIIQHNRDGQLALVLWDGHYRSANADEWSDVYTLTRRTRQVSLDPRTGNVPILVTTQEGSKKGQVAFRVYSQEASVQLMINKEPNNWAKIAINRIREAENADFMVKVDWTRTRFEEAQAMSGHSSTPINW